MGARWRGEGTKPMNVVDSESIEKGGVPVVVNN
jgi:hypothetical protein